MIWVWFVPSHHDIKVDDLNSWAGRSGWLSWHNFNQFTRSQAPSMNVVSSASELICVATRKIVLHQLCSKWVSERIISSTSLDSYPSQSIVELNVIRINYGPTNLSDCSKWYKLHFDFTQGRFKRQVDWNLHLSWFSLNLGSIWVWLWVDGPSKRIESFDSCHDRVLKCETERRCAQSRQ